MHVVSDTASKHWAKQEDEDIIFAAGRLQDYTAEGQAVILAELERRNLTFEPAEEDFPADLPEDSPAPIGGVRQALERGSGAKKPMTRYQDSYRVARTINAAGDFVKLLGIGAGIFVTVGFMALGSVLGMADGSASVALILFGLVAGAMSWAVFWIAGILISSLGEQLLATLDAAVHTSPFLSDDQKLGAMSMER